MLCGRIRPKGGDSMNLFHLRYFVKLAHTRHYTRAAEELCITQPSLSHAMNQLEAELGLPLFERTGRNTTLTRFGEEFLETAERTLSVLDAGVDVLRREARGEGLIRLGFLRTLGVEFIPALARGFLEKNPGRDIRFTFSTGSGLTGGLLRGLSERQFDLVFASKPTDFSAFDAVAVTNQDIVFIVPRGHPLAKRHSVDLADTLPYPHVFFSPGSGMRAVEDELFERVGAKPKIAYETAEDQVVAGLVARGFGVGVVPYMDLLLRLDVKILQIVKPEWERNFYMISQRGAYLSPAVGNFRRYVLDTCSDYIGQSAQK